MHAWQEVVASSVTPTFGEPAETKKARYVVASSRKLTGSKLEPRWPQARAKLGRDAFRVNRPPTQHNFL